MTMQTETEDDFGPKYSPQALHALAKKLFPYGVMVNALVEIHVEGRLFDLRFSTTRGHGRDVEFWFNIPDTRYARRTLIVHEDGRVEADEWGTVPESDQQPDEQPLPDDEKLLRGAFNCLQPCDPTY